MTILTGIRCACGSDDIAAVAPGNAPEEHDLFLLSRGEMLRAWCIACWLVAHRAVAA